MRTLVCRSPGSKDGGLTKPRCGTWEAWMQCKRCVHVRRRSGNVNGSLTTHLEPTKTLPAAPIMYMPIFPVHLVLLISPIVDSLTETLPIQPSQHEPHGIIPHQIIDDVFADVHYDSNPTPQFARTLMWDNWNHPIYQFMTASFLLRRSLYPTK